MKLEAREVGEIKKEKEPECLNQRSSSKQNFIKMSIRLYQTTARNYKCFCKFKNVIIGFLLAIISKMAGLEVAIWVVGITSLITYVFNAIDKGINYILGGEYD